MADSPNKNSEGPVRISVFSDGNPLKTSLFGLISLIIYKEVNRIGRATLVFDSGNMPKGEVSESDDNALAPGKKIRIEAGYGENENPIFEGNVITHRFVILEGNESSLQIECRDYAFPATQARKNKIFEKKKDSEAMMEILGSYSGLNASVDTTNFKHNELVQYYCTDWDFILSRADANGLIVTTEGKNIKVKKPEVNASPKLKVTYGTDVIEFRGELCVNMQQSGMKAVAWDSSVQKVISVEGSKPSLNKQGTDTTDDLSEAAGGEKYICQTQFCAGEPFLQSWADARLLKTGLSRIQGYCKFPGNHKALPGDTIELEGFGKRFNGNAFIGWVEHEIKGGDWVTVVGFGISLQNITENTDVMAPSASGLLPGIQGLYVGKVKKLDGDPTGENKIQVEIPLVGGTVNAVWARLGNFWASSSYGAFFIPDIGDEVILGFFNNDPCHAVILGSLYSSKQKPPYELTKENDIRSIFTKSKMKLEFNEKDKTITVETPAKNSIQISDKDKSITLKDQNKNKIEMSDSGILIESAKDLTLKAKMNVVIDAGANLDAKAKGNVSMKGINIEANANASLTVKGTAKAEISAAGQTVVKGAMVMIN
ncbi:MAG: type VI secretion system tip protein VgrG [Dysgonamonadaceae bacterium]|jgi:Rhs element Vgr protein|nr:type VI secretion system tip protein VgrG [Dysgonamonadaceae bacterium]